MKKRSKVKRSLSDQNRRDPKAGPLTVRHLFAQSHSLWFSNQENSWGPTDNWISVVSYHLWTRQFSLRSSHLGELVFHVVLSFVPHSYFYSNRLSFLSLSRYSSLYITPMRSSKLNKIKNKTKTITITITITNTNTKQKQNNNNNKKVNTKKSAQHFSNLFNIICQTNHNSIYSNKSRNKC